MILRNALPLCLVYIWFKANFISLSLVLSHFATFRAGRPSMERRTAAGRRSPTIFLQLSENASDAVLNGRSTNEMAQFGGFGKRKSTNSYRQRPCREVILFAPSSPGRGVRFLPLLRLPGFPELGGTFLKRSNEQSHRIIQCLVFRRIHRPMRNRRNRRLFNRRDSRRGNRLFCGPCRFPWQNTGVLAMKHRKSLFPSVIFANAFMTQPDSKA